MRAERSTGMIETSCPSGNTLNNQQVIGDGPASEKPLGRQLIAQGFGEAIGLRLDKKKDVVWFCDIVSYAFDCAEQSSH